MQHVESTRQPCTPFALWSQALRTEIEKTFISDCSKGVTKGSKPDRIRIASIPRNFKGAIQVPALKAAWDVEILPKKRATS